MRVCLGGRPGKSFHRWFGSPGLTPLVKAGAQSFFAVDYWQNGQIIVDFARSGDAGRVGVLWYQTQGC